MAGILKRNTYLFASIGAGVVRAYDAIRKMTQSAGLRLPNLIRTSNMRKYMATMVQCLDTTGAEREWIITHLGHTMDVHLTHYRQTSDILERVDVAKVLLIQDTNQVGKFVGKRIEDIQLEKILPSDAVEDETTDVTANADEAFNQQEDVIPDFFGVHDENLDEMSHNTTTKKVKRHMWTKEEEDELHRLFQVNFASKKCPNQEQIAKAIRRSVKNGGLIHSRKADNIKKKMSNMIIKLRKQLD